MNIGILGTGSIARTMAAEFAKVPAFRCEAVCSRQQATGEALAQQFGIPKVYTDYDAMLADPDIELVYIATPNSLHYAQTKAALLAGKNVLCEKPFVPTVAEADELIALAKEKHLFLFEAITTAHHPNYALAPRRHWLSPHRLMHLLPVFQPVRRPAFRAGAAGI
jgi:predicted dehydrogenase